VTTISNPELLSSSKTGVTPGKINSKNTFLIERDARSPFFAASISRRSGELRLYNLV
jgi:hypothetical protein